MKKENKLVLSLDFKDLIEKISSYSNKNGLRVDILNFLEFAYRSVTYSSNKEETYYENKEILNNILLELFKNSMLVKLKRGNKTEFENLLILLCHFDGYLIDVYDGKIKTRLGYRSPVTTRNLVMKVEKLPNAELIDGLFRDLVSSEKFLNEIYDFIIENNHNRNYTIKELYKFIGFMLNNNLIINFENFKPKINKLIERFKEDFPEEESYFKYFNYNTFCQIYVMSTDKFRYYRSSYKLIYDTEDVPIMYSYYLGSLDYYIFLLLGYDFNVVFSDEIKRVLGHEYEFDTELLTFKKSKTIEHLIDLDIIDIEWLNRATNNFYVNYRSEMFKREAIANGLDTARLYYGNEFNFPIEARQRQVENILFVMYKYMIIAKMGTKSNRKEFLKILKNNSTPYNREAIENYSNLINRIIEFIMNNNETIENCRKLQMDILTESLEG